MLGIFLTLSRLESWAPRLAFGSSANEIVRKVGVSLEVELKRAGFTMVGFLLCIADLKSVKFGVARTCYLRR